MVAAQSAAGEPDETRERATAPAEDHRTAHRHLSHTTSFALQEFLLPGQHHLRAEVAAQLARDLVHGAVFGVTIHCGAAHVDPYFGRLQAFRDRLADHPRRIDPAVQDQGLVPGCVAAVHAATGEVDHGGGAFEFGGPGARCSSIPDQHPDVRMLVRLRPSRQHHHIIPTSGEMLLQYAAHGAAASREDDALVFHGSGIPSSRPCAGTASGWVMPWAALRW